MIDEKAEPPGQAAWLLEDLVKDRAYEFRILGKPSAKANPQVEAAIEKMTEKKLITANLIRGVILETVGFAAMVFAILAAGASAGGALFGSYLTRSHAKITMRMGDQKTVLAGNLSSQEVEKLVEQMVRHSCSPP